MTDTVDTRMRRIVQFSGGLCSFFAAKRVQELEDALREIEKFAIYGCGTKQKDVRGKQFAAIQDLARAALRK